MKTKSVTVEMFLVLSRTLTQNSMRNKPCLTVQTVGQRQRHYGSPYRHRDPCPFCHFSFPFLLPLFHFLFIFPLSLSATKWPNTIQNLWILDFFCFVLYFFFLFQFISLSFLNSFFISLHFHSFFFSQHKIN